MSAPVMARDQRAARHLLEFIRTRDIPINILIGILPHTYLPRVRGTNTSLNANSPIAFTPSEQLINLVLRVRKRKLDVQDEEWILVKNSDARTGVYMEDCTPGSYRRHSLNEMWWDIRASQDAYIAALNTKVRRLKQSLASARSKLQDRWLRERNTWEHQTHELLKVKEDLEGTHLEWQGEWQVWEWFQTMKEINESMHHMITGST